MTRISRLFTAVAIVTMPMIALAQEHHDSSADEALMSGMDKMNHDMDAAPMTGNADHDFVAMMIPHHQGAVDMAEVELKYGKDPAMRRLARDIIAAQKKEIALMQAWLKRHDSQ
ncbi:MAG TPA: DUF305 domain-containing protein [Stellaceae bacterium]|jgi:uncharacterized protein (DUF305 family)